MSAHGIMSSLCPRSCTTVRVDRIPISTWRPCLSERGARTSTCGFRPAQLIRVELYTRDKLTGTVARVCSIDRKSKDRNADDEDGKLSWFASCKVTPALSGTTIGGSRDPSDEIQTNMNVYYVDGPDGAELVDRVELSGWTSEYERGWLDLTISDFAQRVLRFRA